MSGDPYAAIRQAFDHDRDQIASMRKELDELKDLLPDAKDANGEPAGLSLSGRVRLLQHAAGAEADEVNRRGAVLREAYETLGEVCRVKSTLIHRAEYVVSAHKAVRAELAWAQTRLEVALVLALLLFFALIAAVAPNGADEPYAACVEVGGG